jgi:hypothetical protein
MRGLALLVSAPLWAQTGADLPAHAALDRGMTLTADYLVRSIPAQDGTLSASDYLVIDAALIGPKNLLSVSIAQFKIRINGKMTIQTEAPGMVISSMTHPAYSTRPGIQGGVGPVVIDSRQNGPSFPGAPVPRLPTPPTGSPQSEQRSVVSVDERVQRAAMPEGELVPPVRGLLFFPYRGKTKSIKSVELLYEGSAGKASLKVL